VTAAPVNGYDPTTGLDDSARHRHFAANVLQTLREDYRLRTEEAELAFGRYLRRQTRWVTPDEAAYDAYRWWTPTVEPTIVLAREAEQRAHAHTGKPEPDQAAQADRIGDDADRSRTDAVEADLAATEAALSLIRGQGQRHGFTSLDVELVGRLKQVLDESPVWDTITPDDTAPTDRTRVDLEPALRPETIRPNDDWDDMIAIDAAFAGRIISVLRSPGQVGAFGYVFLSTVPGHRGTMEAADSTKMGMIASGDSTPHPERAAEYDALGQQVRRHLIGLVDAVAESRELRQELETRRRTAALPTLGGPIEAVHQQTRPTRGTGR
jgi:hypothetical protein